jgi:hypothetical protein
MIMTIIIIITTTTTSIQTSRHFGKCLLIDTAIPSKQNTKIDRPWNTRIKTPQMMRTCTCMVECTDKSIIST